MNRRPQYLLAFLAAAVLGTLSALAIYPATTVPAPADSQQVAIVKQLATMNGGQLAGTSTVSSVAYEASHVIKATPGTLMSLVGYNSKGSAQFIQIYNTTAVPADTAVPIYTMTVATVGNFTVPIPDCGIPFTVGICVANSSTGPTKTVGSADCWFTAIIK